MIARPDDNKLKNLPLNLPECAIKPADIDVILNLKIRNLTRLKAIMTDLNKVGLLTQDAVSLVLQRITKKNPYPDKISITSKIKQEPRNQYELSNGLTFFIKRHASKRKLFSGGQSNINVGYRSADAKNPGLCIKRFINEDSLETNLANAKREAAIIKMLGRVAEWYVNKKGPVVVTPWNHGINIAQALSRGMLPKANLAQRLKWLASGLQDLNALHENYRIHADINWGNFIIDPIKNIMKLIDFGAAQKIDSKKDYVCTLACIDPNYTKPKKMSGDMYMMGTVIAGLFPELFSAELKNGEQLISKPGQERRTVITPKSHITKIKTDNITPLDQVIMNLVDAVMEARPEDRCTSEQALHYCQAVIAALTPDEALSPEQLKATTDATINRCTFTVEDVIRESERPARFKAAAAAAPIIEEPRDVGAKAAEAPTTLFNTRAQKRSKIDADATATPRLASK